MQELKGTICMYLNLLEQVSYSNKYFNWYSGIIVKAKARIKSSSYEGHHILPKSFNLGGEKDKDNIVWLTLREHFICHKLIVKFLKDARHVRKMQVAMWIMLHRKDAPKNSRIYKDTKLNFSSAQKALWAEPAYREKQRAARAEAYADPVRRELASKNQKERMKDPEFRRRCTTAMIESHANIDHSSKEWTERSFNSSAAKANAKATQQTDNHREFCRQRELSKGSDELSRIGSHRRQKQIEQGIAKYGSAEAYFASHSEKLKGRITVYNIDTLKRKFVWSIEGLGDSWVTKDQLTPEQLTLFKKKPFKIKKDGYKTIWVNNSINRMKITFLETEEPVIPDGYVLGRGSNI